MNKMMDMVAAAVMSVARSFNIQVSEAEIVQELKLWNYDEKAQYIRKRYENIIQFIKEPVFLNVFYLALAQYFYPPIYNILREYTGQGVTLHLALSFKDKIFFKDKSEFDKLSFDNKFSNENWIKYSVSDMKDNFEKLKQILKLEKEIENFLYSEFYADERLVMYLMGSDKMSPLLTNICNLSINRIEGIKCNCITEEDLETELEGLLRWSLSEKIRMIIHVSGRNSVFGRSIIEKAYKNIGSHLLVIDLQALEKKSRNEEIIFQNEINREILFYESCICFYINSISAEINRNINEYLEEWILTLKKINQKPICVITDYSTEIAFQYNIPVFRYILNDDNKKDNIQSLEEAAYKYNAELCNNREGQYTERGLQNIKSSYTLDDIKISEKQKNMLRQLSNHIKSSHKVYEQWKMKEKYPYGRNVTALFCGPPGTGKTMAAMALSRELHMPLYKADLSAVMDKYIGETEKRLEKIFSICERSNVILFFDEADVLFGKRSEIKDSRDKFANSSVSYILQRMEQYEGMIILATNLKNNIDNAFLRRIKYVISFHMPDASTRTEIWKSGFTKDIPTEGIDMDFLGNKVELSGGYIKNIIINAAFNAAGDGSAVTMKHIIQSVENEYEKLGMLIQGETLGRYREYFVSEKKREGENRDYGFIYGNKQYQ